MGGDARHSPTGVTYSTFEPARLPPPTRLPLRHSFGTSALLLSLLVTGLPACGDDDVPMRDGGPADVGLDAPPSPVDAGPPCEADEDCDDGIDCTRDFCNATGTCQNQVDPARCDDGIFCNGVEMCDPTRGCVAGLRQACNDGDVCTLARCDEEAKMCRFTPRDQDQDGEVDFLCDGTDCDDRDPDVGGLMPEICGDGKDNNCNGLIDEQPCVAPAHDTCDDALDVSAGGGFELSSRGAVGNYTLSCGPAGRRDLVLTFTLEEASSVLVRAEGTSLTYVALQRTCGDRTTELRCGSGFPGQVRMRRLEPGTYFVLVADIGGDVFVEVDFGEPIPAPPNDTCASPLDVSAGGTFPGSLVEVSNAVTATCGSGGPDLLYTFTIDEPRDVVASALSETGDNLGLGVATSCFADEVRCVRGAPVATRIHSLAPGTYFLVVEGSASRETDFTLDVRFEDPTPPPQGDTCDDPLPLAPGMTTGTLVDKQDDYAISCAFYFRDAVHRFTLDERSDVSLTAGAGGPFMYMSIRSTCEAPDSQYRCVSGNPARTRVRNLPAGDHYVIVESFLGTSYELSLEISPPTEPVDVTGNNTCAGAHVVPATGGLFRGSTLTALPTYMTRPACGSGAASNDVAFRLDLTARSRVVASTAGSTFDTVLHLHAGSCESGMEIACDDDGGEGQTSYLERVLDPGTYFFVVDGWGATNAGEYLFEVNVGAP